jgi:transcriptional regulator with XRE-family HTH domain
MQDKIRRIRKNSGMTQRQVASKMGISYRTYNDFENMGKPSIILKYIDKFASVMGVSTRNLFVSSEENKPSISYPVPRGLLLSEADGVLMREIAWLQALRNEIDERISQLKSQSR